MEIKFKKNCVMTDNASTNVVLVAPLFVTSQDARQVIKILFGS